MVKSETGSSILPLLRMRSANRPQSALKIAFSATISQTYKVFGHAGSNGAVRFDTGSSILAVSAHAQ